MTFFATQISSSRIRLSHGGHVAVIRSEDEEGATLELASPLLKSDKEHPDGVVPRAKTVRRGDLAVTQIQVSEEAAGVIQWLLDPENDESAFWMELGDRLRRKGGKDGR